MRSYQQSERSSQVQKKAEMRPVIKVKLLDMAQDQGKLGRQGTAQSLRDWGTWPVITVVQAWQNPSEDMTLSLSAANLEFDPRNVRSQSQAAEPEIIHLKHMIQFSESSAFSPRKPQISGLDL